MAHLRILTRREWHKHCESGSFRPYGVEWTISPLGVPIEVHPHSVELAVCNQYYSPPAVFTPDEIVDFTGVRPEILAEVFFRAQLLQSFVDMLDQPAVADHILSFQPRVCCYLPEVVHAAQAFTRSMLCRRVAKCAMAEIKYLNEE